MTEPLILFVCTANICRSPWAETRGRELLPGFTTASAGLMPETVGRPMDSVMATTLPSGFDTHRAKRISGEVVSAATLIVTMEQRHRLWVVDEYPAAVRKTYTLGQLVSTLRSAPSGLGLDELLDWAYRNRVRGTRRDDVADPYRQGPEKAQEAAARLESLISEMAGVLGPAVDVAS